MAEPLVNDTRLVLQNSTTGLEKVRDCGYYGMDMSVPGRSPKAGPVSPGGQHECLLVEHLREAHQVGQCNMSKQCYRADHFR
ncbi:hypothetical protein F4775DRAFT_590992 [Biscogniauxia sp. FL1348]|nr:hypothetical protein F4775DRAFT_590992 [Biscogniauxia sp. FL1348]